MVIIHCIQMTNINCTYTNSYYRYISISVRRCIATGHLKQIYTKNVVLVLIILILFSFYTICRPAERLLLSLNRPWEWTFYIQYHNFYIFLLRGRWIGLDVRRRSYHRSPCRYSGSLCPIKLRFGFVSIVICTTSCSVPCRAVPWPRSTYTHISIPS